VWIALQVALVALSAAALLAARRLGGARL